MGMPRSVHSTKSTYVLHNVPDPSSAATHNYAVDKAHLLPATWTYTGAEYMRVRKKRHREEVKETGECRGGERYMIRLPKRCSLPPVSTDNASCTSVAELITTA